jgi:hypothetical protein
MVPQSDATQLFPPAVLEWSSERQLSLILRLLHNLTIAVRALHVSRMSPEERIERLRRLNELMHQLTALANRLHTNPGNTPADRSLFEWASSAVRHTGTATEFNWALTLAMRRTD